MSEYYARLLRRMERAQAKAVVLGDIIRGLSAQQGDFVEHVELGSHHRFNSEATLLVKATQRADALHRLALFPPFGLDAVELPSGSKAIVTDETQIRQVVRRWPVLPFLYSVVQVRKVARHSLAWAHTLDNRVLVTVECDITHDRAGFALEHIDDVAHNQVLFRRVPNEWLPDGHRIETRGTEWSTVKDVPASVTVWWPYDHPKFVAFHPASARFKRLELEEYAEIALEVRQEGHADEKT